MMIDEAIAEVLSAAWHSDSADFKEAVYTMVNELDNSIPLRYAHWEWCSKKMGVKCSSCKRRLANSVYGNNYCPNCGALMGREANNETT